MRFYLALIGILAFNHSAFSEASEQFGSKSEADKLANQIIQIIEQDGIGTAISAMSDLAQPFASTRQGINLFRGSVLIADNREPEMVEENYADITDLNGKLQWPAMQEAVSADQETELLWYHYDTQAVYNYTCLVRQNSTAEYTVMVCR